MTLRMICALLLSLFFFFNDTATTEIYTLSLHDALPISIELRGGQFVVQDHSTNGTYVTIDRDRKSTRLNSSHGYISYAVFCLKKKTSLARRDGGVGLARGAPVGSMTQEPLVVYPVATGP